MAMKKSTKKLLKIAGVVTAVLGIGYFVLKKEKPTEKAKDDEGPPGPGPDEGVPGEPGGPGEPGELPPIIPAVVIPNWDEDVRVIAEDMIPGVFAKMGSPTGGWIVVVSLANAVATSLWPNWSWPQTEQESAAYEGAGSASAAEVWQNLLAMARDYIGFT